MIRDLQHKDISFCIDIINSIWDFDSRFLPQELSNLLKNYYIKGSLGDSNFAVVVTEDFNVRGFLFGRCGRAPCFKTEYSGLLGGFRFLWQLLSVRTVALSRKLHFLRIAYSHERNRKQIPVNKTNEVCLFAIGTSTQGKGYGKQLMNAFIDHCKKENASAVSLETDLSSNFGFYEHFGFELRGEFFSPLQMEYSGSSGKTFVYELRF